MTAPIMPSKTNTAKELPRGSCWKFRMKRFPVSGWATGVAATVVCGESWVAAGAGVSPGRGSKSDGPGTLPRTGICMEPALEKASSKPGIAGHFRPPWARPASMIPGNCSSIFLEPMRTFFSHYHRRDADGLDGKAIDGGGEKSIARREGDITIEDLQSIPVFLHDRRQSLADKLDAVAAGTAVEQDRLHHRCVLGQHERRRPKSCYG